MQVLIVTNVVTHSIGQKLSNRMILVTSIGAGLPWIWISIDISMDISMCGYET